MILKHHKYTIICNLSSSLWAVDSHGSLCLPEFCCFHLYSLFYDSTFIDNCSLTDCIYVSTCKQCTVDDYALPKIFVFRFSKQYFLFKNPSFLFVPLFICTRQKVVSLVSTSLVLWMLNSLIFYLFICPNNFFLIVIKKQFFL